MYGESRRKEDGCAFCNIQVPCACSQLHCIDMYIYLCFSNHYKHVEICIYVHVVVNAHNTCTLYMHVSNVWQRWHVIAHVHIRLICLSCCSCRFKPSRLMCVCVYVIHACTCIYYYKPWPRGVHTCICADIHLLVRRIFSESRRLKGYITDKLLVYS